MNELPIVIWGICDVFFKKKKPVRCTVLQK